jgi:hypothetical protein
MKYLSICSLKSGSPLSTKAEDIKEWIRVSKDEPLHKKCRMIKCYEIMNDPPKKLLLMIDTDEPNAMDLLAGDFGGDWNLEIYPLHELEELMDEDHSIIAG